MFINIKEGIKLKKTNKKPPSILNDFFSSSLFIVLDSPQGFTFPWNFLSC